MLPSAPPADAAVGPARVQLAIARFHSRPLTPNAAARCRAPPPLSVLGGPRATPGKKATRRARPVRDMGPGTKPRTARARRLLTRERQVHPGCQTGKGTSTSSARLATTSASASVPAQQPPRHRQQQGPVRRWAVRRTHSACTQGLEHCGDRPHGTQHARRKPVPADHQHRPVRGNSLAAVNAVTIVARSTITIHGQWPSANCFARINPNGLVRNCHTPAVHRLC